MALLSMNGRRCSAACTAPASPVARTAASDAAGRSSYHPGLALPSRTGSSTSTPGPGSAVNSSTAGALASLPPTSSR